MSTRIEPEVPRVEVPLRGALARVAVVADTHSRPHAQGLEHLAALRPQAIVHAGDIGAAPVLETLAAIAPVHAVRGNIDAAASGLPEHLVLRFVRDGEPALTALLTHVAVAGTRIRADAAKRATAAGAQLVLCGHSHVPFLTQERGLTLFNPGSMGPRRFTLPILFGVLELGPRDVRLEHVDCETGLPWLPGRRG